MGYGMDDEDWGNAALDEMREEELHHEGEAMLARYKLPLVGGKEFECVACVSKARRKHPLQRFCSRKCKDRFHNVTNPERLSRAKLICAA